MVGICLGPLRWSAPPPEAGILQGMAKGDLVGGVESSECSGGLDSPLTTYVTTDQLLNLSGLTSVFASRIATKGLVRLYQWSSSLASHLGSYEKPTYPQPHHTPQRLGVSWPGLGTGKFTLRFSR